MARGRQFTTAMCFGVDGTWDKILQALQVQLHTEGTIAWSQFNVDSTSIRGSRGAVGARRDGL